MSQADTDRLAAAITASLGGRVEAMVAVRGGDTSSAFRVDLGSGGRLFAKTHASPPSKFFTTEAASLAWLRSSGAIAVPEVVAVSDGDDGGPAFLALEWVETGRGGDDATFGAALARLHAAGAPSFGREDCRTTGSLGLPNDPASNWAEFYAARRLLPLARLATERQALPPSTIADLEALAGRLERYETAEPPARLHGDLWAGNRLVDVGGTSWLIDPAAHGGHREFDLAMMALFGGFEATAFAAYDLEAPLADGWRDRTRLHQIAPLVVHAIKFGGSYVEAATAAIQRFV